MRKYLFLLLLISTVHATAQKIDPFLTNVIQQTKQTAARAKMQRANGDSHIVSPDTTAIKQKLNVSFNPDGTVRSCVVFAQFDAETPLPEGVTMMHRIGDTMILNVKTEALDKLGSMKEVRRIQASRTAQLLNETARTATSSAYVTGELPGYDIPTFGNGQHYTGKDVVVGIVDSGIDFNHPAFRNPRTGLTRIKEAVHFENSSANSMVVTNSLLGINALTTFCTTTSHGSHTSATAAGSPVKGVNVQGIAHEADLVLCDCGATLYDDHLVASVQEVFRYAESVGKPAVVNMSIGRSVDFHDGTDIVPYLLSQLTGEGKVMCISAGNSADVNLTIKKKGTIKTMLMPKFVESEAGHVGYYGNGLYLWAATSANRTVKNLSLIVIDLTTGEYRDIQQGDAVDIYGLDITGRAQAAVYDVNPYNNKGYAAIDLSLGGILMTKENTVLGVIVEAEDDEQELTFMDYFAGMGEEVVDGGLPGFSSGTNEGNLNTFACTDKVLSVGAYVQNPTYLSIDGKKYHDIDATQEGGVTYFSSYGIDDNGKQRPDMVTPGLWTVSAYNIYDETSFNSFHRPMTSRVTNFFEDGINIGLYRRKMPYAYGAMAGTSMAAPVATGIVALWLQADPTLSAERIREMLQQGACLNDKWTTVSDNLPSHDLLQAGYGKLDALRGIKMIENAKAGSTLYALDETVSIGADGIATFSSTKPLDFRSASAPKAYLATAYDNATGTLVFSRSEQLVGEDTGLLLSGEATTYNVPIAATGTTPAANYLVSTATSPVTLTDAGTAYVLAKKDGNVGFYKNAADLTIPSGKSYLMLPASVQSKPNLSGFVLTDTVTDNTAIEGEATDIDDMLWFSSLHVGISGIDDIRVSTPSHDAYNINGQRVGNSYHGIIISNGKKYSKK